MGWNKIEDCKPTGGGRKLVWCEGIGGSPGHMEVMHWFEPTGDFFSKAVTHWMDLPEKPEGSA